jgi:hypothetical protein|tara:strand:+ start:548 stop:1123 length:576 start_codon:yes stop_codon:yes gene_type:complete
MSKFFKQLNMINVNNLTEKKGQFSYLSWAWAVRELLLVDPEATWVIHKWGDNELDDINSRPYMETSTGFFVQVTVTVGGVARTQIHPVLDNRNKTLEKPNAFQINTSIQRCLAKAIALHGLGLYIFAGEDVPQVEPLNEKQLKQINNLIDSLTNKTKQEELKEKIDSNVINVTNYNGAVSKITRLIDEQSS